MKNLRGFTLIELMTALTVVAILLTVGVPSFQEFIKSSTLSTRANHFVSDLHFTRSEAIKRSGRVTLCRSSDAANCDTTAGIGWEEGWIAFTDQAGTAGSVDTGDTILRTNGPAGGSITIRGNFFVKDRISFTSSGIVEPNNGTLIICDNRIKTFSTDKEKARAIVISKVGRIRTTKGSDSSISVTTCTPS